MFIVKLLKEEYGLHMFLGDLMQAVPDEADAMKFLSTQEAQKAADFWQKQNAHIWTTVPKTQVLEIE